MILRQLLLKGKEKCYWAEDCVSKNPEYNILSEYHCCNDGYKENIKKSVALQGNTFITKTVKISQVPLSWILTRYQTDLEVK